MSCKFNWDLGGLESGWEMLFNLSALDSSLWGNLGLKPYGMKCGSFLRRVLFLCAGALPWRSNPHPMTNYTRQEIDE